MTSEEVSEYLNIPLAAVGQLVFDGLLQPVSSDFFNRYDVMLLARMNLSSYRVGNLN